MAKKKEIDVNDDDCTVLFNDLTITLHPTIYQYFTDEKTLAQRGQECKRAEEDEEYQKGTMQKYGQRVATRI